MGTVAFSCRSLGEPCEWALVAASEAEILTRAAEHYKCAHHIPELSGELRTRLVAAVRMA